MRAIPSSRPANTPADSDHSLRDVHNSTFRAYLEGRVVLRTHHMHNMTRLGGIEPSVELCMPAGR